jgi:AcrR family transcriptional regulator
MEAAAQTRRAVLDAARELFVERGYLATTVQDIASAARVATATVYASVGGKPQLLHELITASTSEARRRSPAGPTAPVTDPVQLVVDFVAGIRQAVQEYGDIAELILTTAHVDTNAASTAAAAEEVFRGELGELAMRLQQSEALSGSVADAVDVLAYYLGYSSWRRLVHDFGWSLDAAQDWLTRRITEVLLIATG